MSHSLFDTQVGRAVGRAARFTLALGVAFMASWGAGDVAAQTSGTITGTVINATNGSSIAGAQISIVGTEMGTLSNNIGRYIILNVPPGTVTVRAEFIGFGAVEQEVNVIPDGSVVVDFELRSEAISLEGVVVTGTAGAARRREIGNSIAQVNSATIENDPVSNVGDILQGRAAGVTIMDNSGQAGTGRTIRLRGNNSVSQGNQPLIYVDGIRVNNDAYPGDPEANQAPNPLDDINPEDIERVEVVKGAAATTLYGTEAAGGVIQIFTKRGASGAPAWSFTGEWGANNMGHVGPDKDVNPTGLWMNDCTEWIGCPESGSWLRTGFVQDYNLSVRGGNDVVNYFLSGNWGSEEGVIPTQGLSDYAIRGNFGFTVSENLNIRFNTSYNHRDIDFIPDGNNAEGLLLNVIRGDADYTPDHDDSKTLDMKLNSLVDHFIVGSNIVWNTGPVTHRFNGGLDWSTQDYTEERPWEFFYEPLGDREVDEYTTRKITLDYSGTWATNFAGLSSDLSFGAQYFDDFINGLNGFGYEFAGPGDKEVDSGARTEAFETRRYKTTGGFFLQEMVGWNDLFFLTLGLRVDGHSAFGEDFGWAPYPKVSASWIISDMGFFPESMLGEMKIRGAYGESGKAPGFFDAERTWDAVSGDEAQPAVTPDNVGNPDLGPERTSEIELGVEGALFNGRLSYEYTYYTQTTNDALIPVTQTPSEGFVGSQLENVGKIENWGHELFLNANLLQSSRWGWDLGFRLSTNNSEVKDLGGLESISLDWRNYVRPGQPLPVFCHDVVQNPDAVGVAPIMEEECLGTTYPTLTMGINTSITFGRRLTLDVLGERQSGHWLSSGTAYQNVRRYAWPPCFEIQEKVANGDTADMTAGDRAQCDRRYTTYGMWTKPADFFKLRSAALSYRMPDNWLPRGIRAATLRVQGRNLFVSTDFPGLDPEAFEDGSRDELFRQEYYNLPPARRFLFSMKVDF